MKTADWVQLTYTVMNRPIRHYFSALSIHDIREVMRRYQIDVDDVTELYINNQLQDKEVLSRA